MERAVEFARLRGNVIWRTYEYVTAFIGWAMVALLVLNFYSYGIAPLFDLKIPFEEFQSLFFPLLIGAIGWVKKFDFVKYRITRDPRDEPFRKWFSFKYAQRFKPGEVFFVPNEYNGDRSDLDIYVCPDCQMAQGYMKPGPQEIECKIYGCKSTVAKLTA